MVKLAAGAVVDPLDVPPRQTGRHLALGAYRGQSIATSIEQLHALPPIEEVLADPEVSYHTGRMLVEIGDVLGDFL